MKYSLINVDVDNGETVDGYWLQDVNGTFEDALRATQETERVNSYRIQVAVVEQINSPVAILGYWKNKRKICGQ